MNQWSGSPDEFLEYGVVRAAALLEARFRAALRPEGLTPHQFSVLVLVYAHPDSNPAELARRVLMTPQSIGMVIEHLEGRGLIKRRGTRKRGTPTQISLTAIGRRTLASAWRVVAHLDAETRNNLGADYGTALEIIQRLIKGLETKKNV
jgi:DNA-binding MarR family transcriptional regulator